MSIYARFRAFGPGKQYKYHLCAGSQGKSRGQPKIPFNSDWDALQYSIIQAKVELLFSKPLRVATVGKLKMLL